MYDIYSPCITLRPFIECFWFLATDGTATAHLEEVVFTDARADLMLCYGSPYLRQSTDPRYPTQLMHRSHIDAQRRYPVHIVQQGQINLVGVRFRPCGLAAFLPLPMSALQGLTLDLYSIFGPRGDELEHRLFDVAYNRHQQLSLLNEFFMRRLNVPPTHALVSDLATMIDRRYGQVTIRELGYTCGYSVRTVDRLFQEVMGLSPKFYARAMRLRHTLHGLVQYPATPWADLVGNYGYYDQPHFIKEFAALTGLRPEEYRTRVEHYRASPPPNHVHFLQDDLATEPIR